MKNNVKTMVLLILTVSLSGIFSACVPPKLISDHYNDSTPLFMPTFEYEVNTKGKVTSGDFTIGIILPSIEISNKTSIPLHGSYLESFHESLLLKIEEISTNKGIKIIGFFESYDDMTYPERSECDFIIYSQIGMKIGDDNPELLSYDNFPSINRILLARNEAESNHHYVKINDYSNTSVTSFSFDIHDPLTNLKLERFETKTKPVKSSFPRIIGWNISKESINKTVGSSFTLNRSNGHPNYMNDIYGFGSMLEGLYPTLMKYFDDKISISDFERLKKYKDELEEKKRY